MKSLLRLAAGTAAAAALAVALTPDPALAQAAPTDTLRVAVKSLPPGFGRADQGTASPTVYATWPIYDSLTKVNLKSEVEPQLALSWKNINPTTWEVTLRPNVKYHNGDTLTAEDVAGWYNHMLSDAGASLVAGTNMRNLMRLERVEAIGPLQLRFISKSPQPIMPNMLSQAFLPNWRAYQQIGLETFTRKPVGSGPYKAVDLSADKFTYTAHTESWRAPKIPNMVVTALGENATRVQAINSNQIDIAQGVSVDSLAQIEGAGHKVDFALRPSVMGWRLFSVSRDTPFKDKRVRQAANFAIDRGAMNDGLLHGKSAPASQCATTFTNGYNPNARPYTYDPNKAKALLTEAGHPQGFNTVFEVLTESFPADADIYQKASADLNAAGIRNELRVITFADWLKKWFVPAGTPTLGFVGGGFQNECHNDQMDAIGSFRNISCRLVPAHHCDPEEDRLLNAADSEFDPAKRTKILQDLLALNSENAAMIYMVELRDLTGLNKRVQGFKNEIQRWNYHEVTFAR